MAIIIPPHHRACRMKILLWAFILCLPSLCTAQAPTFTLGAECVNGHVDVVQGQPRDLTCSGLTTGNNIYWSITPTSGPSSGVERRVAKCSSYGDSHTITRNITTTTLGFTSLPPADSGAVIKCSSQSNQSQVTCGLRSINSLNLAECDGGYFDVAQGQPRGLTCSGLTDEYNIYWTITATPGPNSGVERKLAECQECAASQCNTERCDKHSSSHTITRTFNTTTLFFNEALSSDSGAIIKCSSRSNATQVTCELRSIPAFRLPPDCTAQGVQFPQRYDPVTCTGMTSLQEIYWTITYSNRTTRRIADCGQCSSPEVCPPCQVYHDDFSVDRRGQLKSELRVLGNDDDKVSATLLCSALNNVTSANCELKISYYRIAQCHTGTLELSETQQREFICEGLRNDENMNWTLSDASGTDTLKARCTNSLTCWSANGFSASRTVVNSTLVVQNYTRESFANRTLTCVRRDGRRSDSCKIRVIYPADHGLLNVTLVGWEAVAIVDIRKVFDSDNNVSCVWVWTGPGQISSQRVTRPGLSPFVDPQDARTYYRGTCRDTLTLNGTEGPHSVSITVTPGEQPASNHTFVVARPGLLITDPSSCPAYVAELSKLSCLCLHPAGQTGYPAAEVTWQGDGGGSPVLEIGEVGRGLNGSVRECRSVWGPRGEVNITQRYTLMVATRPTTVTVTALPPPSPSVNETSPLLFTCTAPLVLPSVNFTWSLPCETLTHSSENSTCAVSPEEWRHVTEVVCLAVNSAVPALNMTARYRRPGQSDTQSQDSPLTAAVGGALGVAVVLAAVVVIVIVVVKRRGSQKPMVAQSADEFEEYINDAYQSNDDMGIPVVKKDTQAVSPAPKADSGDTEAVSEHESLYANTAPGTGLHRNETKGKGNAAAPYSSDNPNVPQSNEPDNTNDEYAVVCKTKGKDKPGASSKAENPNTLRSNGPEETNNEYAVVYKPKGKDKTAVANQSENATTLQSNEPGTTDDEYSVVCKTNKKGTTVVSGTPDKPSKLLSNKQGTTKVSATKTNIHPNTLVGQEMRGPMMNTHTAPTTSFPESNAQRKARQPREPDIGETYYNMKQTAKGGKSTARDVPAVHKKPKGGDRASHKKMLTDVKGNGECESGAIDEGTEYANVPQRQRGDHSSDVYMNMGEHTGEEVTKAAESDDEYHNLHFNRVERGEDDGHYDHLEHS